jgi:hypothetical protein
VLYFVLMPTPEFDPTRPDNIPVTAINTAMNMAFSGIPYFPEIAEAAQQIWRQDGHSVQPQLIDPGIHAPGTEIRYRQVGRQLLGATQIVDIAAGLTPRGLTMTTHHPDLRYVEFDLPVMSGVKRRVLQQLAEQGVAPPVPSNLHLLKGNAMDPVDVMQIADYVVTTRPVYVTTEGLLHYLSRPERARVATNIATLIRGNPHSRWFTDMPTQEGITKHDENLARITSEQSNRDVAANRFETRGEAARFFADYGIEVAALHSYVDPDVIDSLTSPAAVGANLETVKRLNAPWCLWEFRATR